MNTWHNNETKDSVQRILQNRNTHGSFVSLIDGEGKHCLSVVLSTRHRSAQRHREGEWIYYL